MKDDKPSNIPDDQDIQDSKAPSGCPNHWKNQIFCDSETTEYVQGIENPLVLSKDGAKIDIEEALSMCDAICLENPGFRNELIYNPDYNFQGCEGYQFGENFLGCYFYYGIDKNCLEPLKGWRAVYCKQPGSF